MGVIKTFSEFINESFWGDVHKRSRGDTFRKEDDPFDLGKRAVEISKAIKASPVKDDYTLLEIENENLFNTDFICRRDTKYNLDINSDETCKKISILKQDFYYHRDKCIPYFLYVHNEIPIDDEGNTTSLWLEYGVVSKINEEEYEPANWYYLKNEDQWVSDYYGKFKENLADEFLIETFRAITPVINPNTKYKTI